MRSSNSVVPYILGGIAVAIGVAVIFREKKERGLKSSLAMAEDWTPTVRIVTGVIGGGLMLYGNKSHGKLSRAAVTAGMGLVARSLLDQPVREWKDVIQPESILAL